MLILFPLCALIAIGVIYRADLGGRSLLVYAALWGSALAVVLLGNLSPGVFVGAQCLLAVCMLIQVRANPQL